MSTSSVTLDPKIRFLISVPDWRPEEATPFQGFSPSLCQNSHLLRFIQRMPTDIFELTPALIPYRLVPRIAGQAPINWYGQSPRALKSDCIPIDAAFTFIMLDRNERASDYEEWATSCPWPVTLIAEDDGHITYSGLSFEALQKRLLEVCGLLRVLGTVENVDEAEAAIASWVLPEKRQLPYEVGGHGTIVPNLAALLVCGFTEMGKEPFGRIHEGEKAHLAQIVLTTNTVFDEREANPASLYNQVYPRTPDLNLYCPATFDQKSTLSPRANLDRATRRQIESTLRILNKQSSYSFEISSDAKKKALFGITDEELLAGGRPKSNPVIGIRQREIWLGTEAVACIAASEIGAVIRLPNRLNLTRGAVRQFSQHYRAERPQMRKRNQTFQEVQRAIADGFPADLQALIGRSRDGIRVIADAHVEWLDVRGIPLGLRYNVSRIPVTPGNLFIQALSTQPPIHVTPEDFQDILVVSGLPKADAIAKQFDVAFDIYGEHWREKLRINFVRVSSRQELIDAINGFEGMLMVFDGHGSHKPKEAGLLWLGKESVDVWSLEGELHRPPPIVILSACDTHAADRNHATVANGFLALGSRSVLGSVFPLHASHAAVFTARLLYRVSYYIPAAIKQYKRSLTWLEIVSGMLRRQLSTDIFRHLESLGLIAKGDSEDIHLLASSAVETQDDPFSQLREVFLNYGIPEDRLDQEIRIAIAASPTISYLHLGRPETIVINTAANLNELADAAEASPGT
jgi:hypothetical protein